MSENIFLELLRQTLYLIVKVSAPMLIVSLAIGLIVSILQTVTSIQEQTLTFVPKLIGIFLVLAISGNWIFKNIVEYFNLLMENIQYYIRP